MQRIIIIAILLLQVALASQAQQWAPVGAKWYYNGSGGSGSDDTTYYDYYLYESVADTTLLGINCRKITVDYFQTNSTVNHLANEYMYSDSGKVYYYRYNKFNLLYDFTAKTGDTISITDPVYSNANPDTISRIVIDSIKYFKDVNLLPDSATSGFDSLKVFFTHSVYRDNGQQIIEEGLSYHKPVIENIGSTYKFFPTPTFIIPEEGNIRCYSDADKFFKPYPYSCDRWKEVGIKKIDPDDENILVFPNPSSGLFTITINEELNPILSITNVFGQFFHEKPILNSKTIIDLSNLPKGIYFLRLKISEKEYRKKIIIQ